MQSIRSKARNACGILLVASLTLTGCAGEESTGSEFDQVAARVNSEEISAHQVIDVLTAHSTANPALHTGKDVSSKQAARLELERLVDRELLAQQAEKSDLDSNPQVRQALESARKDILARAYLNEMLAQQAKPDPAQVTEFYTANPALFSQRKIYTLREINLSFPNGVDSDRYIADLQSLLATDGASQLAAPLERWARERDVAIHESNGVKAAEELPMEVLPKFSVLKQGDIGYLRRQNGATVFRVLAILDAPISEDIAQETIERILMSTKQTDLVAAEMKRLRGDAQIEYLGEFADTFAAAELTKAAPLQADTKKIQ